MATPVAVAERGHGEVESAERAEEEEKGGVGGGVVDGVRGVRDADVVRGAGRDVELVVAGAWVRHRQSREATY